MLISCHILFRSLRAFVTRGTLRVHCTAKLHSLEQAWRVYNPGQQSLKSVPTVPLPCLLSLYHVSKTTARQPCTTASSKAPPAPADGVLQGQCTSRACSGTAAPPPEPVEPPAPPAAEGSPLNDFGRCVGKGNLNMYIPSKIHEKGSL